MSDAKDAKSTGAGTAAVAGAGTAAAVAIASGSKAPFKLAKTVLTSFEKIETDPTYVLHMTVSASKATAAATPTATAAAGTNSAAATAAAAAAAAGKPNSGAAAGTAAGAASETCCVAAATSDHVVKLYGYDLQFGTLTLTHQLVGHRNTIHDVQFVPGSNNTLLVTASEDGQCIVWDARTAKPVRKPFRCPTDPNQPFFSAAVAGPVLAAGTTNVVYIWNLQTGALLHTFDFHTEDVTQVRFHPLQSNTLITGSVDGTISIIDLTKIAAAGDDVDDALDFTLTPEQPVSRMGLFGPRSEFLYSLSTVETLSLWNLTNAELIADFKDVRQTLTLKSGVEIGYLIDCVYEPASQRLFLAAGNASGTLVLAHVNKAGLTPLCRLDGGHAACIRELLWVGQTLITGGEDAKMCTWTALGGGESTTGATGATATTAAGGSAAGMSDSKSGGGGDAKSEFPNPAAVAAGAHGLNSDTAPVKGFKFNLNPTAAATLPPAAAAAPTAAASANDSDVGMGVRIAVHSLSCCVLILML